MMLPIVIGIVFSIGLMAGILLKMSWIQSIGLGCTVTAFLFWAICTPRKTTSEGDRQILRGCLMEFLLPLLAVGILMMIFGK